MLATPRAPSLDDLRRHAATLDDVEEVGRWALAEDFAPGGRPDQAALARKRLEALAANDAKKPAPLRRLPAMWSSLARAVFDDEHGQPTAAAESYVDAATGAAADPDPRAPLVGWFAVRQLLALRGSVAGLFANHRARLDGLLAHPGNVGWRAVAELEEWRAGEVYAHAEQTGDAYDADVVRRMGCAHGVRIAGPFGHGSATDPRRSFDAEASTPWPLSWPPDPMRGTTPRRLSVTQTRCVAAADEQVQDGVFYAESFFTTHGEQELVVAVQGAVAVWVDGARALSRGPAEWGSWQRFGAHVAVVEGRHRVLARTVSPVTSVRYLNPDGTAAGVESDGDPAPAVAVTPARVLADPNPIDAITRRAAQGDSSFANDPVVAALAAYAAHVDQMDDVASVLVAPLAEARDAAPMAMALASTFVDDDPALPEGARGTRARLLRARAVALDASLWRPRLASIVDDAQQHGAQEAIDPLRTLAAAAPLEPEIVEQLAQLYGRLGWRADQMQTFADVAARFPDDTPALRAYLDALDENGPADVAEQMAARIRKLDPDAEVDLDRALARHDYKAALAELDRLKKRRPERKELAARVAEVLARSGEPSTAAEELEKVLAKHPRDAHARFRLADLVYAKGDSGALRRALAAALQAGAPSEDLRAAIDLVEGATDLEPYRKDGLAIIREYQAWEKSGHHMDGTAARVLDYSAIWVQGDGSSEMLEHEIQKIQSQEAINAESETEPPTGLVLRLRVIKPDGRVLEPEPIAGKPTLTMPHLEVGDFIELEHIAPEPGDGAKGKEYRSPHWFFREADKGYWRSEFVMVTPADRELEIETRGSVPPPQVKMLGTFVERRWRVDLSPPAEIEPESPPIQEFLPSVRVGWGVSLDATLARLVDLAADETPLDPRLRARALEVVHDVPGTSSDERARRLYRWVVEHVQENNQTKETDGRRVIMGGSGSRQSAFRYLLRLVGIESELAIVKDRLAAPPAGKLSDVEQYSALVTRIATDVPGAGARWLVVRDRFAPYGYVPAELRGASAIRLVDGMPRDIVHAPGAEDRISYDGRADVRPDGSAGMELTLTFEGNRAIAWRSALDQVPQAKIYDFVEREIVAPSFDGGHVREMKVESTEADTPLIMHLRIDVPEMAKPVGGAGLALRPPFAPNLTQLALLPTRRTPLLRRASWHAEIRVRVVMPDSAKMPADLPQGEERDGAAYITVRDAVHGHAIDFDRVIEIPAARVAVGEEYGAWLRFVRAADALIARDVAIGK
jgi:tetratricopeptide (TPR) repeat protein